MHRTKMTVSVLALIVMAALLIGGTVFANDVGAKSKKKFKINVILTGVAHGTNDEYIVYVNTYYKGFPELQKSKLVDTSSQTCPGDWSYECYTPAGSFSFPAKKVSDKTFVNVCVEDTDAGNANCQEFQKKKGKSLPTLKIEVPQN